MRKILFALALGLSSASGLAVAQEFKMGYVSLERILVDSVPAKKARADLEVRFKAREKALDQKAASIRANQQGYEKESPKLSEAQRKEREADLTNSMEAFNVERSEFEEELAQAQSQMLKSLLAKADATIKVLAEQEGFDFVVQEAVYIKPEYDLTVRVLEKMR